jgi:pyrroloquinoline quinone biosynthesis protein E
VRTRSLDSIWRESEAFNRFRGTDWMPEPCANCPQKEVDFAGCRCQAALLTGNAANTDPVCSLGTHRPIIDAILAASPARNGTWAPRHHPKILRAEAGSSAFTS